MRVDVVAMIGEDARMPRVSRRAALKALGYSNRELGWHYVKWGLAIAESRQYLPEAWWFATFPGLAIALTAIGGGATAATGAGGVWWPDQWSFATLPADRPACSRTMP